MIDLVVVVGFIQAFSNFWSSDSCQNQNQIWNIFAEPHQSCLPCFITHKNKGNKMWVCLNCHEYNSSENENCSECHSARPQSRTGNTKAKVSPKELDSRALDDRKECNVNEAIGDIINISDSERTNVKNENGYLDGMKQIQKPDCQGPVMSRNQTESFPERLPTTRPGRQGGQSYTNQYQEGPQKKYTNLGYNQPPNQFQGCNQPPNQYQGNSQEMYTNQGHNQQSNQHQIYNQPQNQYQAYNHPPPPQHFQYVIVPFPVLSGSPSGHGPAPYPPVVMPPYNPPNLPQDGPHKTIM